MVGGTYQILWYEFYISVKVLLKYILHIIKSLYAYI